jgi:hypothetical protein
LELFVKVSGFGFQLSGFPLEADFAPKGLLMNPHIKLRNTEQGTAERRTLNPAPRNPHMKPHENKKANRRISNNK